MGYAISCICVYMYAYICHKISAVWHHAGQKVYRKASIHAAFLLHLDIMNVTVNCYITPGRVLLPILCSYLCAALLGCGIQRSDVRHVARCGKPTPT